MRVLHEIFGWTVGEFILRSGEADGLGHVRSLITEVAHLMSDDDVRAIRALADEENRIMEDETRTEVRKVLGALMSSRDGDFVIAAKRARR